MWKKENLRKNFLRVKQIADQNLGRSEKSEVLTEDLLAIERRVDIVKQVFLNISKKISSSLQAQGDSEEKRLKKLPETYLALCLSESASLLGNTESLLGMLCHLCGEVQNILAREQLQCEINIEKDVLFPLQSMLDNDLPAILKAKKNLTKTTLDMDSAKSRLTAVLRQSQLPSTNVVAASSKVGQIKDELEEAEAKVEYVKDHLAIEMSNFLAKETEQSHQLLVLVEAQAAYHKKALEAIQAVIPRMQQAIDNNPSKPVFGNPLEEHLRVTGRDIAVTLEACIVTLLFTGMDEEGLFRIAGASSKLKKLKACFDVNIVDMEEFRNDPHTVAGVLKQYLRELPEPLLTYHLYAQFMQAATLPKEKILPALNTVVEQLPVQNYNNFRYLIKFLSQLAKNSDVNKMNATNIAIVIAPNLLWSQGENAPNMMNTGSLSTILEAIISNADYFFPEDINFSKTMKGSAPAMSKENINISTSEFNKSDGRSSLQCSVSRQGSSRNSRLDFYNNQIPSQNSQTSSQNSFGGDGSRSKSVSVSSDIPMDTNVSYDNASLDECFSAMEGDSASNHSKDHSSALTNHSFNQSPIRYINQSQTGSSSPRSRSVPPAQVDISFHSDVYSTVTALQSLGSGSWTDYFSKVQAVRNETFHHTSSSQFDGNPEKGEITQKGDTTPSVIHSNTSSQTRLETMEESKGEALTLTHSKEIDFHDVGEHTPPSMSPVQCRQDQRQKLEPEIALASQITNLLVAPMQSIPRPASPVSPGSDANNTVSIQPQENQSPDLLGSSPRVLGRMPKKHAPPPPSDRPYSVAVTASVNKTNTNLYQTWPRQQNAPLASPEMGASGLDHKEETTSAKPTIPERPHPPTRQGGPPDRPERPKAPPPSVPQGHNRSASTGGMVMQQPPSLPLQDSSNGQGLFSSRESLEGEQLVLISPSDPTLPSPPVLTDKHGGSVITKHRLSRPTPPPPPPPINRESEETHL